VDPVPGPGIEPGTSGYVARNSVTEASEYVQTSAKPDVWTGTIRMYTVNIHFNITSKVKGPIIFVVG
jgi:hypothetical protein